MPYQPLFICGSGGFAREVAWIVQEINRISPEYELLGAVSPLAEPGAGELPWLGPDSHVEHLVPRNAAFVVAVGNPALRLKIAKEMYNKGFQAVTLIHPGARIGPRVRLAEGTIVAAGSTLTTDIYVGSFCIINLHVTIGHDSSLDEGVTLHPAVNLAGGSHIGAGSELGTGAIVLPNISLCPGIILGAGAVANRNITVKGTYVGVPAKQIS